MFTGMRIGICDLLHEIGCPRIQVARAGFKRGIEEHVALRIEDRDREVVVFREIDSADNAVVFGGCGGLSRNKPEFQARVNFLCRVLNHDSRSGKMQMNGRTSEVQSEKKLSGRITDFQLFCLRKISERSPAGHNAFPALTRRTLDRFYIDPDLLPRNKTDREREHVDGFPNLIRILFPVKGDGHFDGVIRQKCDRLNIVRILAVFQLEGMAAYDIVCFRMKFLGELLERSP